MLTLRKRLFIIIGVVSGLVIAILLGYYLWRDQAANKSETTGSSTTVTTTGTSQTGQTGGTNPNINTLEKEPVDMSVYAKQVATIFVERFATYSNQNRNQNIDDVLDMSTPVMVRWLESQRGSFDKEYQGITTSVVATKILSIDNANAIIEVNTQQQIMSVSGVGLEQKTGKVELVLDNGDWKVNGFYWHK